MAVELASLEDEKVKEILQRLGNGESREEIAQRYKMTDRKSLDQYMRRREYRWNQQYRTYNMTPLHPLYDENKDPTRIKAMGARVRKVLQEFERPGADAKDIARRLNFLDHMDMAKYMEVHHYVWSPEARTYVSTKKQRDGWSEQPDPFVLAPVAPVEALSSPAREPANVSPLVDWGRYLPLIQFLHENDDKIRYLLEQAPCIGEEIPRLKLPGRCSPRSIHMNDGVKQLLEDYSRDNNVRQRDIVEVALVEFFRKYGYATEVEIFLKTGS